jgi:DNA-binding NarL/FixJ family response regulator
MSETPAKLDEEVVLVAPVDDNRISRDEHAKLLNAQPGVVVISAEATLNVTTLTEKQPDVVLVESGSDELLSLRAAVTTRKVLPKELISPHTVKSHIRSAMEKTGFRTRIQLAMSPAGTPQV